MGKIEHGVAHDHHQLFILAPKRACERALSGLDDDAISDPLPELRLRRPELLAVTADDQGGAFLFLLLFLRAHFWIPAQNGSTHLSPRMRSIMALESGQSGVKQYPVGKPLKRGSFDNVSRKHRETHPGARA